jgi:hypothetical protein
MDSSDTALLFASGSIASDPRTADAQLRTLSLLTFKIARGRNWARWVFAVVFVFGVLSFLFLLTFAPQQVKVMPALLLGVAFLQFALQGAAFAQLFTREASHWFKTTRAG